MTFITGTSEMRTAIQQFIRITKAAAKRSNGQIKRAGKKILVKQPIRFVVPLESLSATQQADLLELSSNDFTISCHRYLEKNALLSLRPSGLSGALPARVYRSTRVGDDVRIEARFAIEYDPDVYALNEQNEASSNNDDGQLSATKARGIKTQNKSWFAKLFS